MTKAERNEFIVELRRNGAPLQQIADRVNLTRQQVNRILRGNVQRSGRGQGLPCPECQGESKTIRTLPATAEGRLRRHECRVCRHRWTSEQKNLAEKLSPATYVITSK